MRLAPGAAAVKAPGTLSLKHEENGKQETGNAKCKRVSASGVLLDSAF